MESYRNNITKKNLVIINPTQFGYHTDTYKYCEYLRNEYNVIYICNDQGRQKQVLNKIKVYYNSHSKSKIIRELLFIIKILRILNKIQKKNSIVFIVYFRFAFFIRLFCRKHRLNIDIRTGSVNPNPIIRFLENRILKFNLLFFKNISVISQGLAKQIGIKEYTEIPLGSDILSHKEKTFKKIHLLYVGTLYNRNIEETVLGLKKFMSKYNIYDVIYDIFGFGMKKDINVLNNTITENKMLNYVRFHGQKTHSELKKYFDSCNVGVSYIPIKKYFSHQPPTKTFEYILSGMACIGTATIANLNIINDKNGIVCNDSPEHFADSLYKLYTNRMNFDSKTIRKTLINYKWERIIRNTLREYLNNING